MFITLNILVEEKLHEHVNMVTLINNRVDVNVNMFSLTSHKINPLVISHKIHCF